MKKIIALTLAAALALCLFAGCAGSKEDKVIKVGASVTPHAEILRAAEAELEGTGYTLEIVEFTDYTG